MSAADNTSKSAAAFRTISEVSGDLNVPQHVLRFWETKFPQVKPLKRAGRRRYYRPEDLAILRQIRDLLYKDGYTIKGVQKLFKDGAFKSSKKNTIDKKAPKVSTPSVSEKPKPGSEAPHKTDTISNIEEQKQILMELKSIRTLLD